MPIDTMFSSLRISASGLTANRRWMDAIAENLANAKTTRTEQGGPYRRKITTFKEIQKSFAITKPAFKGELGVRTTQTGHMLPIHRNRNQAITSEVVAQVGEDTRELEWVYDPDHPDANEEGYVAYPNVDVVREMVDLITASRAYEANVTARNAATAMNKKALAI